MVRHTVLTLGALTAVAHSKAIVTNFCNKEVYVYSIPNTNGYAENERVKGGGGQYTEPFHQGTSENPGIAIKISTVPSGVMIGQDELDFAYAVDPKDPNHVWVDVNTIRGNAFGDDISFHNCFGSYKPPFIPIRWCNIADDIELVLCGSERTVPEEDPTPREVLMQCASPHKDLRHANRTQAHRVRSCQGRVTAPKKAQASEIKAKATEDDKDPKPQAKISEYAKHKADVRSDDRYHPGDPLWACKCRWGGRDIGFQCACHKDGEPAPPFEFGPSDNGSRSPSFKFGFADAITDRNLTPDAVGEQYGRPVFAFLWENACTIAADNHLNCTEFKAAIKAVHPDVVADLNKAHGRNSTKKASGHVKKSEEAEARKKLARLPCEDFKSLYPEFRNSTTNTQCRTQVYNAITMMYGNLTLKVPIGGRKDAYLPDMDSSDLDDELTKAFPKVNWSTDDDE